MESTDSYLTTLREQLHTVFQAVDASNPRTIAEAVAPLRALGIIPNCHIGRGHDMDDSPQGQLLQLEWYAGQILSIVDGQQWFAVNSWLNTFEKFVMPKD